ncbi:MAG: RNA methyltransferase [Lachnospiraceae bacterium]|nr:RNA methyltransferase [Lachnospiraceae bacterium]
MITSNGNEKIKRVSSLLKKRRLREEERVFVCEGRKMYFELLRQRPELLKETYWSESGFAHLAPEERALAAQTEYELVADSVFERLAETVTPQGVCAVVGMPEHTLEEMLGDECRLILLERLQDPGNLGTILRTAEAAGMTGVILSEDSVDAYNPKVVRSTMGAIFRVPFLYAPSLPQVLQTLAAQGVSVFAAHLAGSVSYDTVAYGKRYGILIGNEANGLSDECTALAKQAVRIPMYGQAESLNAAVACAVLAYESRKPFEGEA